MPHAYGQMMMLVGWFVLYNTCDACDDVCYFNLAGGLLIEKLACGKKGEAANTDAQQPHSQYIHIHILK